MNPRNLVVLLAAIAAVAGTARLGLWQLDRAAQKTALQRGLETQRALPALGLPTLPRDAAAVTASLHRRAVVQGRWRRDATVLLDNRALEGHPGFIVVTPLELADGTSLAVERGWLPRDLRERTRIAPFATPEGTTSVEGRVAATPSRLFEFAQASAPRGAIRQNLDLDAWAREHALRLLPWVLRQEDPAAATVSADGLLRRWPAPAVDVAKNYGYAVQWFALSALVAGLYVWFHVVRPLRGR